MSIARSADRVHKDLVGSLDREDIFEARIDAQENGHDCGPDQSTVIVLQRLHETVRSCGKGGSYEITNVELNV